MDWPLLQLFGVDTFHLDIHFILTAIGTLVAAHILHGKLEYVFILNGVNNGVFVQTLVEQVLSGVLHRGLAQSVFDKDRRTGKTKQMIILKRFRNASMHIAKLGAVAFIKNKYSMPIKNLVLPIAFNKMILFLNSSDNNPCVRIFKLSF